MQVGLLSDTHGFLDEAIFTYLEKCGEVWHAGDFGPDVLDRLKAFKPVRAVFGNRPQDRRCNGWSVLRPRSEGYKRQC